MALGSVLGTYIAPASCCCSTRISVDILPLFQRPSARDPPRTGAMSRPTGPRSASCPSLDRHGILGGLSTGEIVVAAPRGVALLNFSGRRKSQYRMADNTARSGCEKSLREDSIARDKGRKEETRRQTVTATRPVLPERRQPLL